MGRSGKDKQCSGDVRRLASSSAEKHQKYAQRKDEDQSEKTKDAFIENTRQFWQQHYQQELTPEDTRQISDNLVGFFAILAEWDAKQSEGTKHDEN